MNDYQISEQRISPQFNAKATPTLEEKVEILRKSLPQDKHPQWNELKSRIDKETKDFNAKQEKARPVKLEAAYNTEHARLIQSIHNSNMPPPPPHVIEHNAKLAASRLIAGQEQQEATQIKNRSLEKEYDFLKKQQPDHPLVKSIRETPQPTQQLTNSFNMSATKQGGMER